MKSNEINAKELELKYQIEQLEKQKQEALVSEGKAYLCKNPNCKHFVEIEHIGKAIVESGLCEAHWRIQLKEERKQKLLKKLKLARVIDIEIEDEEIRIITVYKNGMLYDLEARYDSDFDDEPKIIINHEHPDEHQYDLDDITEDVKPWHKERLEKPLVK